MAIVVGRLRDSGVVWDGADIEDRLSGDAVPGALVAGGRGKFPGVRKVDAVGGD